MEGVGNNNDGVFFLAATNLPWNLDSAFLRRCQKKIFIPLPDEKARAQLFRIQLEKYIPNLLPAHCRILASRSEGFSGSDIKNVVNAAVERPVEKMHSAKYWKQVGSFSFSWERLAKCVSR